MKNSQILALLILLATGHGIYAAEGMPVEFELTEEINFLIDYRCMCVNWCYPSRWPITEYETYPADEKPAKLYEMYHKNLYGTCLPQRFPNPYDDQFDAEIQSRFSCQELINHKDKYGDTFLHRAIGEENIQRVEQLIELGADVNSQGRYGKTPLHQSAQWWVYAAYRNQAIQLLLDAGADVNQQDKFGNTPLHCAVVSNHSKAVELFIDAGANIKMRNIYGQTARQLIKNQTLREMFDQVAARQQSAMDNSCCSIS